MGTHFINPSALLFANIIMRTRAFVIAWLLAFPGLALAHDNVGYSHDRAAVGNLPAWMSSLDDNLKLSEISIPGTHDSMADCPGLACGPAPLPKDITQTQSMNLPEQLVSGIRALDIRLRYQNILSVVTNPLSPADCAQEDAAEECTYFLYHGIIPLGTSFQANVMNVVTGFLADNPSETIIMRVKIEGGDNSELFARRMELLLANYAEFLVPNSCNPSFNSINIILGPEGSASSCHARGRIAIVRDYRTLAEGHLYDIGRWGNLFAAPQYLQDEFSVSTNFDLYSKWEKVRGHLLRANERDDPDRMWGNFLSASGGSFPYFIASGHLYSSTDAPRLSTGLTTPLFSSYPDFPRTTCVLIFVTVCTISFEGTNTLTMNFLALSRYYNPEGTPAHVSYVGVVMSDFPGIGLIQEIIRVNEGVVPSEVNEPPVARCQDIQIAPEGACTVEIVPELVDGGSFDPELGSLLTRSLSRSEPLSAMGVYPVTLTVADLQGLEDSCEATITFVCDSDGDGIVDDDDAFPNADTEITVPRQAGGDIAVSVIPEIDTSSCNLVRVWFEPLSSSPPRGAALDFEVGFELIGCAEGEALEVTVDFGKSWPRGSLPYKVVGDSWLPVPYLDALPEQPGTAITYRIVDNGPLDSDPASGRIVDPVTMAMPPPIPSLPWWLLLMLSMSLAGLGLRSLTPV